MLILRAKYSRGYGTPRISRYGSFLFLRLQVVDQPFEPRDSRSSIFQAHGIPCVFHAPRCQILATNHRISPSVVTGKPTANPPSLLTTTTPLPSVKLSSLQQGKVARPTARSNFNHMNAWLPGIQDYTHPRSLVCACLTMRL